MKNSIIASIAMATLFACNNPKSSKTETENNASMDTAKTTTVLPTTFYKRLEGTIAGKAIIMNLQRTNEGFSGGYYYNGPWLDLASYAKATKDSVYLNERNLYSSYFGLDSKYPKLTMGWNGNGFNGTWISGDSTKRYPIKLQEKYPEGSYKFSTGMYNDSIAAIPKNPKSPMAQIDFTYLKPEGNTDNIKWLDAKLKKLSGIKETSTGRQAGFENLSADYFKNYTSEVKTLGKKTDITTLNYLNYYRNNYQSIAFNNNDYIIVESLNGEYAGGAHGNYATLMACLDVKNKKELKLSDVVKIDSNTFQKIVEKNFRKLYNIKPNGDLKSVLFDNFIKPNNNFYFNQFGLAFMYNPYEVASYAQGQVAVFIPFAELTQYLNPEFKTRMGL
ncbi:hypothetical protein ABIB40_002993 [Pedobacter sp. UYP30]|uniref:RsiV family protein n=1 Tax=Pedobacter sp. UYP30 TaxID=1756400 RepID=UPI0033962B02